VKVARPLLGTRWALVSDWERDGGVSTGTLEREVVDGRMALRLARGGTVWGKQRWGSWQMAVILAPCSGCAEWRAADGLRMSIGATGRNTGGASAHARSGAALEKLSAPQYQSRAGLAGG